MYKIFIRSHSCSKQQLHQLFSVCSRAGGASTPPQALPLRRCWPRGWDRGITDQTVQRECSDLPSSQQSLAQTNKATYQCQQTVLASFISSSRRAQMDGDVYPKSTICSWHQLRCRVKRRGQSTFLSVSQQGTASTSGVNQ